jgi:hypothetical protein
VTEPHALCWKAYDYGDYGVAEYQHPWPNGPTVYDVMDGDGETVVTLKSRADAYAFVDMLHRLACECDGKSRGAR